jgi:glycosyltransferase involved in cell wall biosynthesis
VRKFDYQSFKQTTLPTEKEIMFKWGASDGAPLVSVLCAAFNQQAYIEDAIRGFLIQKTDFPFEIIIHDDASTDSTPEILEKYASIYPNLINLVLQGDNQYSQGKKITPIIASYARGEYFAICEGDDFWFDENKLQAQYLSLKKTNSELCFTHGLNLFPSGALEPFTSNDSKENLPLSSVVRLGGGHMASASLMVKRDVICTLPSWFESAPVGDAFVQIIGCLNSPAVCLPVVTTAYRVDAVGSWNQSRKKRDAKKVESDLESMLKSLESLSNYRQIMPEDINNRRAYYYLWACDDLLDLKDFSLFKKYISLSVQCYPNYSLKQSLYNAFRWSPFILCYMKRAKGSLSGFLR